MKPDLHLHTNITPGQSIDFHKDFLHAFGGDLVHAVDGVPVLNHKKSATVLPFSRSASPSAVLANQQPTEVITCSNDIYPNPTSAG